MSLKLKVLPLALVAMFVVSGGAVTMAPGETGGHFSFEEQKVELKGEDIAGEKVKFHAFNLTVECDDSTYSGSVDSATKTTTELTIAASYPSKCVVLNFATVKISMNGCHYLLTVRKVEPDKKHNTVHLNCPGKGPTVVTTSMAGDCELEISPNQTPGNGVVYETAGAAGKTHDLTVNVTATGLHVVRLKGTDAQCATASTTTNTAQLTGKLTLRGFKPGTAEQTGITATGP